MSIVCGKCSYVRGENEHVPDWQCPSCGVAYNKVKKIQAEAAAKHQETRQPTKNKSPKLVTDENSEAQSVISGQQYMLYGVLLPFVVGFLVTLLPTSLNPRFLIYGFGVFSIFIMILVIVGIMKILSATGSSVFSKVLHGIFLFLPVINIFVLFSANRKANIYLKHYGYDVGALGPTEKFLNAPKFYGILFISLILTTHAKINKATNPIEVAKSLNAIIKPPHMIGKGVRFDGVSVLKDSGVQRDFLVYKFVLINYEEGFLEWNMGKFLTDDAVKKDVCAIQNLHKNLTGQKAKYQLRVKFYNKFQVLIKQVDIELAECRMYRI